MAENSVPESSVEVKLEQADNALTKFGKIMKKHWGKLLFIGVCIFIYESWTNPEFLKTNPPEDKTEVFSEEHVDNTEGRVYSNSQYYLLLDNVQYGPYTMKQIEHMSRTGAITTVSLFWKEGMSDWASAEDIPEISEAIGL